VVVAFLLAGGTRMEAQSVYGLSLANNASMSITNVTLTVTGGSVQTPFSGTIGSGSQSSASVQATGTPSFTISFDLNGQHYEWHGPVLYPPDNGISYTLYVTPGGGLIERKDDGSIKIWW